MGRAIAALLLGAGASRAEDYVWWEGESPTGTSFPRKTWFSASTFEGKRHVLSGGEWLTNAGEHKGEGASARYAPRVPQARPSEAHSTI